MVQDFEVLDYYFQMNILVCQNLMLLRVKFSTLISL